MRSVNLGSKALVKGFAQVQRINEHSFTKDHRCSLKVYGLPAIMSKIFDSEHRRVGIQRSVRQ